MLKRTVGAGALLVAFALGGCTEQVADPRPQTETAKIRLVHGAASPEALALKVDGSVVLQSVSATEISGFAEVPAGDRTIAVTVAGSSQNLIARTVNLIKDKEYTMLVSGTLANMEDMIASDTAFTPLPGKVKIRVIHAARNAPPLDVYLTAPGEDLATAFKLVEPFQFNVADTSVFPGFAERDPGDWQVRFTDDGTTNVVLDTGPFTTSSGQIITVVLSHDGNNDLVARIVDETPGIVPERIAIRVNHAAPSEPTVALHVIDPGQPLSQPHLFISPFYYGADSSTVTFLLPPNNGNNLDFEVVFTLVGDLTPLASSGPVSAPVNASKLATFQPKAGGGLEVVVTDAP
jgi:Domain of unknown function (DUF4397)